MKIYIVTETWWEVSLPAPDPMADTCGTETVGVFDSPEKAGRFIRESIEREIAEAPEERGCYFDGGPVSVDEGNVVGQNIIFHKYAGRGRAYRCAEFEVQ